MLLELRVLNGDQAGLQVAVKQGTYRILRRSAENFDVRSTLVSNSFEQWGLSQEDFEMIRSNLTRRVEETGEAPVAIDAFERGDDIAVWDQRVSQPHAMILVDTTRVMLIDMGSRNGCFVNGERIGAANVEDGDLIRCGATRIQVHLDFESC